MKKLTNYEADLERFLKNKHNREYYEAYGKQLRVAYRLAELRQEAKLSQAQVAKKMGTKQSNIARLESGEQNFTYETLDKLATIFGKKLEINFV
ncbi:MAG: transcriptional regulator [Candidatus Vogelbacteria bacterium CG10_big_fil_rev_8_21_14_0_10_45_14]|uniref:Transcriptional regulator n=1 Tax=Candidatus Vogelbacteria bacterium CG10_big_fil_rev_8_21_14_0_10_45_14 TaxID=1975042 RepID=A0A2H0RIQ5_9BACT|nr:MAG: transcriptional regulator [Candidatus Vogelbacteria bacterium CG10_big_fil_rev_8_21_14_0_10_45_14]